MNSWQNTLLVGSCVTYLAGRVVIPLLGKSAEHYPYLAKMNAQFGTYWAFGDFATVSSSIFVGVSDVSTLFDARIDNDDIRHGTRDRTDDEIINRPDDQRPNAPMWTNRPNIEMISGSYTDRCVWVTYRSLATILKIFSAYVLPA